MSLISPIINNSKKRPFFIDWTEVYKQDLHPAKTSAAGCRLITLIVEAQDPTKYNEGLYYSGVGEAIFANNTVSVCCLNVQNLCVFLLSAIFSTIFGKKF